MKKSKLEIYALAICFVTVVCAAVSLGIGIWGFIELTNPEFTMNSHEYERYQSNDKYFSTYSYRYGSPVDNNVKNLSEEEKTKKRLADYSVALKAEKHGGAQTMVRVLIIIVINVIVFMTHWIIARRARETNVAA